MHIQNCFPQYCFRFQPFNQIFHYLEKKIPQYKQIFIKEIFVFTITIINYKLIHFYESNQSELYNLKEDAGEKNDLSLIYPEKTKELLNRLIILKGEMNANSVKINPNFKSKKDQIK